MCLRIIFTTLEPTKSLRKTSRAL